MVYAQKFGEKNSTDIIGFKTEATRADGVVMMNAKNMMDYLMDTKHYASLCPGILASAKTIKVCKWPTNAGSYDGAMHLMTTESVFPSPLVQSRKCTFVRYCRELQNGSVLVVDVSLDGGDGTFKCCKMPSGVLIQPLERNSCTVIAIEHVLVDDTGAHKLYQPYLSGLMFGARRWLTSIARQCVRIRDLFLVTGAALRANSRGRKTLMKLADDLLVSFSNSIVTILRMNGQSCVVPWDVLVNGGVVREEVRVSSNIEANDAVSILHFKNSCYDVMGSFIVYSPIDNQLMNKIMSPGDMAESKVSIYPTGFSLLPVGESAQGSIGLGEDGETLVTVGFQILLKLARGTGLYPRSVTAAIDIMSESIVTIKESLINSHPIFYRSGQDPSPI
ncbi:hypothetical protein ACQ4PT_028761 [Festuca glaucescens]